MRIAVTGGSGLVGRRIVGLLSAGHDVVNVDLREPPPDGPWARATFVSADVRNVVAMRAVLEGCEAVVHAAGIPGPSFGSEEEILETNVEGTRNVAEAAEQVGMRRFVFISSEAVLGVVFSGGRVAPRRFPIDETHPLGPTEAYGKSKLLAETLLARRARSGMTVVALRPPWVWVPEEYDRLRQLTRSPGEWADALWAYVHGDDLARAAGRALTADVEPGLHAVYVAAPDNGTVVETRELIAAHYPEVPVASGLGGYDSLISSGGLRRLIGFQPRMSWRDFLG